MQKVKATSEVNFFRYHMSDLMEYLSLSAWPIFLNIITSSSIHIVTNNKNSFFYG
jgi:hypothetical protein